VRINRPRTCAATGREEALSCLICNAIVVGWLRGLAVAAAAAVWGAVERVVELWLAMEMAVHRGASSVCVCVCVW
jgi:hypothetical protein